MTSSIESCFALSNSAVALGLFGLDISRWIFWEGLFLYTI